MTRLTLTNGKLRLDLAPTVGGSIARFDHGRQPLLRPAASDADAVLGMACFPLVPYCNRIRDGRFLCNGREIVLTPNMAGDPSPLHGQGWLLPWTVAEAGERVAVLSLRHEAGEWPWHWEAHQRFELHQGELRVSLTCRNLSPAPMPCGLGLHPYYPCDAETVLDTEVAGVWRVDEHVLPVDYLPAEGRYALTRRKVCGQGLDNGYDGWSGEARFDWGREAALTLKSVDSGFFQLYAPPEGGYIAAEPVQHANCALNAPQEQWNALGIVMLAEGEARSLTTRFVVEV